MKKNSRYIRNFLLSLLFLAMQPAVGAPLSLSQVPLFLGGSIEPNVVFTLDDSGSMQWENMPDDNWTYFVYPRVAGVYGGADYGNFVPEFNDAASYSVRIRSYHANKNYYNPAVTYVPWATSTGSAMANAPIGCAPHNPAITGAGCRDLTANNTESASWELYNGAAAGFPGGVTTTNVSKTFWPAVYYNFTGTDDWVATDYTKVQIISTTTTYTGSTARTDCAAKPSCTYAEEIQNFANWYTYYRSRILLARAGVGIAFSKQGSGLRVGFGSINQGSTTVDGQTSPGALITGVRKFTGTDRQDFFDSLYDHIIPTSGTPLRRAQDDIGQYFERSDNEGPWGEAPGTNNTTAHMECRQSYHVLMTDGYWNGAAAGTAAAQANVDNTNGSSITSPSGGSFQYLASNPYMDAWSDTLADVAMYYWNRDLRTGLANKVPTNPADDAFWQHMVTFPVGLGVTGSLDPLTDLAALTSGAKAWPQPTTNPGKVDDLWHSAVNSRGEFFSAQDPASFATALGNSLSAIAQRVSSASSIATNSTRLDANTFIYQARFDSSDWHGQLLAYKINPSTGEVPATPTWDAGTLIPAHASRKIFTFDSGSSAGKDFVWSDLTTVQKNYLINGSGITNIGQDRLNHLRGDSSKEQKNSGSFRNRNIILGDIANSDPWFVGQQNFGYNILPSTEGTEYLTFRNTSAYKNRTNIIYISANDGMLHAFDATTGVELFAYIPENIFPNLWQLTDPAYTHQYFVDAPPKAGDAYIGGNWKTILVGSTGAGGKSVFALDITSPATTVTTTSPPTSVTTVTMDKTKVLWEFTDTADLGYTIGQPSIVRMANGHWGAIFGNGYNSTSGKAILFIKDMETGTIIKIDTLAGSAGTPNGLATPTAVDTNSDGIVDAIYAGDLLGNVWSFDVSNSSTGQWKSKYKSGANPAPLFTATDGTNPQPITGKIEVGAHPTGGVMVYFGTGKYIETGDASSTDINTIYGIWDDTSVISSRANLLQQEIQVETSGSFAEPGGAIVSFNLRVTSENAVNYTSTGVNPNQKGWYMDLLTPVNVQKGERVVSAPIIREGRIVFTTIIPDVNPCDFGGTGWLMELTAIDGSRPSTSPFDLNNDGSFSSADYITVTIGGQSVTVPVSGKQSKVGMTKTPGIIKIADKEFKYTSGSTGNIERTVEARSAKTGRQSWKQIQ